MSFEETLYLAKEGNEKAILEIVNRYRPLLIKNSLVNGIFDEDLYQELVKETLLCIKRYKAL